MSKTKLTEQQAQYIIEHFGKLKISEIAKELKIKTRSVSYFCKKLGLKLDLIQRHNILERRVKKYYHNDNFFSDNTNESAYWAGFIAADGCIIKNRIRIKLKSTDENHLISFIKSINSNCKVLHSIGKRNETITYSSLVSITSKKMIEDLSNIYNITENKSFTLQPPLISDTNLIHSFIKGIFDGDGTIYYKDNRYYCIVFYGTKTINSWIKEIIDNLMGVNSGSIYKKKNIFCYEMNKSASEFFINYFKKIKTPFLERKWCK